MISNFYFDDDSLEQAYFSNFYYAWKIQKISVVKSNTCFSFNIIHLVDWSYIVSNALNFKPAATFGRRAFEHYYSISFKTLPYAKCLL